MKVINIHKRLINQPQSEVAKLFETLATAEDRIWPKANWPAMKLDNGLNPGSRGGHGRIRYTIKEQNEGHCIVFKFTKPVGFDGIHKLSLQVASKNKTEVIHEIRMNTTTIRATLLWTVMIRWLHDALIEEAFNNIEQYFSQNKKRPRYSIWVYVLRGFYKITSVKLRILD